VGTVFNLPLFPERDPPPKAGPQGENEEEFSPEFDFGEPPLSLFQKMLERAAEASYDP